MAKSPGNRWQKPRAAAPPPPPPQPQAPRPPIDYKPHLLRLAALWLLALLAYSNSFRAGMTLDNEVVLLQDTRIQAATAANVNLIFSKEYWYGNATTNLYRPLTTLSYLFNYSVLGNGKSPAGYHVINFALHALNIALVYLLGLLIFRQSSLALGLASLWGLHPVLTESVTNIVGRADLLAGFSVLAALLCHARATRSSGARRAVWLAAIAVVVAIGVFSKESAIVVLAILPLFDLLFARDTSWESRVPGYLAALPAIAIFFVMRSSMLSASPAAIVPFVDNPLVGADFLTARLTAIKVIGKLFALCLWPAALSCDYSYNQVPLFSGQFTWENVQTFLALFGCLAAVALAIRFRRHAALLFFIAFFFIALSPTANIALLVGTIMAERFLYLPLLGVVGCAIVAYTALARRVTISPRTAAVALGAVSLAFCIRTFVRNNDWLSDRTLWTAAVRTSPNSFKVHSALAMVVPPTPNDPDPDFAIRQMNRELEILNPLPDSLNSSQAYYQAGLCYRLRGEADPAGGQSWYAKAAALLERGERIDRAEQAEALAVNMARNKGPYIGGQLRVYLELAHVYRLLHRDKDALAPLAVARAINPKPEESQEMSDIYRQLGDREGAAIALLEGLVIDPGAAGLASSLMRVYRDLPAETCALTKTGDAYSINMECPLVHGQLCQAARRVAESYQLQGRARKAAATTQTAVNDLGCPAN